MTKRRKILILVIAALLVTTGMATYFGASATKLPEGPFVGQQAPDFLLMDLEGRSVRLSDYRGKYVILNFWATWCGYCRAEMPYFNSRHEATQADGTNLAFLTVNRQESLDTVKEFMQVNEYTLPVLLDIKGAVSKKYFVSGIPQSILIDPEGVVVERFPGMMKEYQLDGWIKKVK